MKKLIFFLLIIAGNAVGSFSQILTPTATANCPYSNPPQYAIDGNPSTCFNNDFNVPISLILTLSNPVPAMYVNIIADTKRLRVDVKDINGVVTTGYYYTLNATDNFLLVNPIGIKSITISSELQTTVNICEVTLTEENLTNVSVNYTYDNGGNMITRTLFLSVSSTQKSAEIAAPDTSKAIAIDPPMKPIEDIYAIGKVLVYPNPTKGLLKIEVENYKADAVVEMQLFTISGQMISSKRYSPGETIFDLQSKPAGTYLLNISVGNETHKWTIIKE
jgi:hypothetical protein